MPLITCPDCSNQISDRAPTCPHCGAPMAPPVMARPPMVAAAAAPNYVTTQRTSKPIKFMQALASLALLAFICIAVLAQGEWRAIGMLGIVASILAIIGARWARWWMHE